MNMRHAGWLGTWVVLTAALGHADVTAVKRPDTSRKSDFYVGNRAPLVPDRWSGSPYGRSSRGLAAQAATARSPRLHGTPGRD